MSTPNWKKNFILIFGLFENLIFSGTILGWSALNYMLKSEAVYENICDVVQPHFQINDDNHNNYSIIQNNSISSKNNGLNINNKLIANKTVNKLNKAIIISRANMTFSEQLEADNEEPRSSPTYKSKGCTAQDNLLNLAFTIGSFFMGFTAFIWGFLLNKWGLRIVRLSINFLITGGAILLCFTNKNTPYLIFPAITLICLGGTPLRIADMQFADLYPSKRSTVISLYSGAFCASAVVFALLKYLYDFGVSYFVVTLLFALTSLFMFPFTLFVLPPDRIQEESQEEFCCSSSISKGESIISPLTPENFTSKGSPYLTRRNSYSDRTVINISGIDNNHSMRPVFEIEDQCETEDNQTTNSLSIPPLKISLWSLSFNLHQWWYSWLITYMVMYVGSMNLWLQRVTNDLEIASNFVNIYGISQIICLVLAPVAGLFMDYNIKKADQETDPFERKLKRIKAGFWPIFFTTLILAVCLVCHFFDNRMAIYFSIAFMTAFRAFLLAVGTSYLRIRFHGEHFSQLLGIIGTICSIVSLLQFPLFLWESKSQIDALWVNILNCLCTLLAFANPLHILITPLQRHLLLNEEREEAKAKSK